MLKPSLLLLGGSAGLPWSSRSQEPLPTISSPTLVTSQSPKWQHKVEVRLKKKKELLFNFINVHESRFSAIPQHRFPAPIHLCKTQTGRPPDPALGTQCIHPVYPMGFGRFFLCVFFSHFTTLAQTVTLPLAPSRRSKPELHRPAD